MKVTYVAVALSLLLSGPAISASGVRVVVGEVVSLTCSVEQVGDTEAKGMLFKDETFEDVKETLPKIVFSDNSSDETGMRNDAVKIFTDKVHGDFSDFSVTLLSEDGLPPNASCFEGVDQGDCYEKGREYYIVSKTEVMARSDLRNNAVGDYTAVIGIDMDCN